MIEESSIDHLDTVIASPDGSESEPSQNPESLVDYAELYQKNFVETLGITFTYISRDRVEADMSITPQLLQPFGFLHGGVTLALLETVSSMGSTVRCDLDTERPFGVEINARHRKPGISGVIHAVAEFDREEPNLGRAGGVKQFWKIAAYDETGDVISNGTFMNKVVPL